MRLLDTKTLRLEYFVSRIPPYAILSHTWGDDEVLFDDMRQKVASETKNKKGWEKIARSCARANEDHYDYIWIDTCCIDKSSSAELSESINSMFKWYKDSQICYAYLSDISRSNLTENKDSFTESRWFTRGWTLQELIAPPNLLFLDANWEGIGLRGHWPWCGHISDKTAVPTNILSRQTETRFCLDRGSRWTHSFHSVNRRCTTCFQADTDPLPDLMQRISIYERMKWAKNRQTSRPEDQAYCLLGLFGINMPLLYGENQNAFIRLQKEIISTSNDQSLLLRATRLNLFATSPLGFRCKLDASEQVIKPPLRSFHSFDSMQPSINSIKVILFLCPLQFSDFAIGLGDRSGLFLGILNCLCEDGISRPALLLKLCWNGRNYFISVGATTTVSPDRKRGQISLLDHNLDQYVDPFNPDDAYPETVHLIAEIEYLGSASDRYPVRLHSNNPILVKQILHDRIPGTPSTLHGPPASITSETSFTLCSPARSGQGGYVAGVLLVRDRVQDSRPFFVIWCYTVHVAPHSPTHHFIWAIPMEWDDVMRPEQGESDFTSRANEVLSALSPSHTRIVGSLSQQEQYLQFGSNGYCRTRFEHGKFLGRDIIQLHLDFVPGAMLTQHEKHKSHEARLALKNHINHSSDEEASD